VLFANTQIDYELTDRFQRMTQVKKNPFYRECPKCNTGITAPICITLSKVGGSPAATSTVVLTSNTSTEADAAAPRVAVGDIPIMHAQRRVPLVEQSSVDDAAVHSLLEQDGHDDVFETSTVTPTISDTHTEVNADTIGSLLSMQMHSSFAMNYRLTHTNSVATNSSDIMESCMHNPEGLVTPASPGTHSVVSDAEINLVDDVDNGNSKNAFVNVNRLSIHNNSIHFNIDSVDSMDEKDKLEELFVSSRAKGLTSPLISNMLNRSYTDAFQSSLVDASAKDNSSSGEIVERNTDTVTAADANGDAATTVSSDRAPGKAVDGLSSPELVCPGCSYVYCFYHSDAHPGLSCEDFARKQSRRGSYLPV
jgi:hypothetical protein